MPEKTKLSWWIKNIKLVIYIGLIIGGVIVSAALLLNDVGDNKEGIKILDVQVDSLIKRDVVFNQSFTSFREAVEEDLEDIEESLEDMAEEQSGTHDLTIKIAAELGVD